MRTLGRGGAGGAAVSWRAVWRGAVAVVGLAGPLAGCGTDRSGPQVDPVAAALDHAVQVAALPPVSSGRVVTHGDWLAHYDTTSGRLLVVHAVADLVLPDGPIELLEPVVSFHFDGTAWRQQVGPGAQPIPEAAVRGLAAGFTDRTRHYFVRASAVSVPRGGDTARLVTTVQSAALDLARDAQRLRRAGFISADAAP